MFTQLITYRNVSIRVWYCSACMCECSQMRYDLHLLESGGVTVYAQHDSVQLDVRTGPPGVTIGASVVDIRDLCPSRHPQVKIFFPYAQPFQIIISQADLGQRLVNIEFEINCRLCKNRIVDYFFGQSICFGATYYTC